MRLGELITMRLTIILANKINSGIFSEVYSYYRETFNDRFIIFVEFKYCVKFILTRHACSPPIYYKVGNSFSPVNENTVLHMA